MITKEDMQNFYFQYIVREDLDGDPLLSLNLLEATVTIQAFLSIIFTIGVLL